MIARFQDGPLADGLHLAARLLLAAALLPTGLARMLNVSGFALSLAGAGVPAPNAVATAAVVVQVFGPLALILGVVPRVTGLALAGFCAATAVLLHPFWHFAGAALVDARALMLADLGLAGGFLVYALHGPGGWSWQGWRAVSARGSARPAPWEGTGAGGRGAGRAKGTGSAGKRPAARAA